MSSLSTDAVGGGLRQESEDGDSDEGRPHSAAVELGMHIEDCAAMLPGYLSRVDESLRGIEPHAALPQDAFGPRAGWAPPTESPGETPTAGLGGGPVYERLRSLQDHTVRATLFIRPAYLSGGDSDLTALSRPVRVSFNFLEGFRLLSRDGVAEKDSSQEEAHPTYYESLLSLLLVNFWDVEPKA